MKSEENKIDPRYAGAEMVVMDKFRVYLRTALKMPYVRKPVAWAVYHVWKWIDKNEEEIERNGEE